MERSEQKERNVEAFLHFKIDGRLKSNKPNDEPSKNGVLILLHITFSSRSIKMLIYSLEYKRFFAALMSVAAGLRGTRNINSLRFFHVRHPLILLRISFVLSY